MSITLARGWVLGTAALLWGLSGGLRAEGLKVGAAAVELIGTDAMVIGGGIGPGKAQGQEGKLRAVALVLQGPPNGTRIAIVACDILMIERDILDDAAKEIERTTGIPFANVLINATHTHHAPTTVTVHGYKREEAFARQVGKAVAEAVQRANEKLDASGAVQLFFKLGKEDRIGQNSRLLLADGTIFWVGSREDAVRPTGPFDPDLPVLAFKRPDGRLAGLLFNHSTHTIGTRSGAKRSPSFYGLAAQELEEQLGTTVVFLEGASGSTHNLSLKAPEMIDRLKERVTLCLKETEPLTATPLSARKREIAVKVRHFDEEKEDAAVRAYCGKRIPTHADAVVKVFRDMRRQLAGRQGEERKTWVQALRIGEVAIVGVPAEYFTKLGVEIKRQSPFPKTYVAELANDWIGYVPDSEAFDLGGYQVWTGLHSYVARGTGEQIVKNAVELLRELKNEE